MSYMIPRYSELPSETPDYADRPVFDMQVSDYRKGDIVKFTAFGNELRQHGVVLDVGQEYITCAIPTGLISDVSGTVHRVDIDNIQLL